MPLELLSLLSRPPTALLVAVEDETLVTAGCRGLLLLDGAGADGPLLTLLETFVLLAVETPAAVFAVPPVCCWLNAGEWAAGEALVSLWLGALECVERFRRLAPRPRPPILPG